MVGISSFSSGNSATGGSLKSRSQSHSIISSFVIFLNFSVILPAYIANISGIPSVEEPPSLPIRPVRRPLFSSIEIAVTRYLKIVRNTAGESAVR